MEYSIVNYSYVLKVGRLDPEYFQQDYLKLEEIICKGITLEKIANICDLQSNGAFKVIFETLNDGNKKTVPYIRSENVGDFFIKKDDLTFISKEAHSKLKKTQTRTDDILMARKGKIGGATIVTTDDEDYNSNDNVTNIRIKDNTNPYYLTTFLNSKYGIKQVERQSTGNVQPWLSTYQVRNLRVLLPTSKIQTQIAELVKLAKNVKDTYEKAYKQAEHLLLSELGLADYIPNQANTSIRDLFECLQDDRFDAEYWMPKYDEIIERIKEYKNGYDTFDSLFAIGNQTSVNPERSYQYVELADVNSTLGTIESYADLLGKELPSRGRMSLKKDDVIMSSLDSSLNKTALVTSNGLNFIGSTGFFVLSRKYFEPEVALVLLKLKPIQEYIARQAQGTILTAIPKTSLSRIVLPKITNDIQSKVKNFVQEAHTSKEKAQNLLEKAKRAVEIFIEQDEEKALEYLAI